MSILGLARFGSLFSLSILDSAVLGSSMSVRSFARLGSSISILNFVHVGASFSLRSFGRMGSSLSLFGLTRFGSLFSLSVMDCIHLGASLAIRSFAKFGASLSVLDFVTLSSSVSVRSFARFGSSLSVLDFVHFASSMSMRSFCRLGSAISILDFAHIGSSLSVRSFARIGSTVEFNTLAGAAKTYIRYATNNHLEHFVGGSRSLSLGSTGGVLHGVWSGDQIMSFSDERLKDSIMPLNRGIQASVKRSTDATDVSSYSASWVLRELRPVSYHLRQSIESKAVGPVRFGFIAQELERVLPNLVHTGLDKHELKGVMYQDIIALLAAAGQESQQRLDEYEVWKKKVEMKLEQLLLSQEKAKADIEMRLANSESSFRDNEVRRDQLHCKIGDHMAEQMAILTKEASDLRIQVKTLAARVSSSAKA